MELSIYSTIILIVIIIELSLVTVVFLGNNRFSAKVFSLLILLHLLWVFIEAAFHGTTSQDTSNFLAIFTHYVGGIIATTFFYFSLVYPEDNHPTWKTFSSLALIQIILLFLYGSGFVIGEAIPLTTAQRWGWEWGPLGFLFHLSFFGFWSAGLFVFYKKLRTSTEENRKDLFRMLVSMFICIVPISIITILLPAFGIFTYSWIGSTTSIFWVLALAYFIIKKHGMNVRVVLAEIFVLAATIILFVNIFIAKSQATKSLISPEKILNTVIFAPFFGVGYMLIINMLKESEQKEKIERLNTELSALNTKLEEKVKDRTKELNESKKHIETIIENLTLGIVEYDTNFTILRINQATEQLFNITKEEVIGKVVSIKEAGPLRSLSKVLYDWQTEKVEKTLGVTYTEISVDFPKQKELQVITIPIRNIPFIKISGFVKLIRDVTHERAIDRGKSDFISIVAHQLSASLDVTAWALDEILLEETNEKQKELLHKTQHSNENIMQITADLLNAARIDGKEFHFYFEKQNIVNTIEKQLGASAKKAEKKSITVTFNNEAPAIQDFLFDEEKITMALKNILTNALDYTPTGGKVTLTLSGTNDGYVVIAIQDSGIGIPKEELSRIFTKFYRSKEALLMETDRSGLGLYITKNIIEGHKGTIQIDSKEGAGVLVTIKLPVRTEQK